MTIGSDNLSSGNPSAQDRFSGGVSAYRQNRREGSMSGEHGEAELMGRGGHGPLSAAGLPTRNPMDQDRTGQMPALDMQGLTEPVFPPGGWIDSTATPTPLPPQLGSAQSMADHPLLRGLLMELPGRGAMPASDWLDRWFEAARSILELLYVQESNRGKQ
ncbi:hypothetical protein [Winogradskya humida]|uniref:Uncharacterized protein n=1 Tax=Winogradskya humida TaxID=113566 RepID=A0ABQ3ZNA4_9ACTN|nr:hypothetical protein [Actinoplanes humidus]GIE20044.1 hypothetical protein Ahu01nite_031460 [Actinoplanes humidus]